MKSRVSSLTVLVQVATLVIALSRVSQAQTNLPVLPPLPPIPHDGDYVLAVEGDTGALKWVPFGDIRFGTNSLPALPPIPLLPRRQVVTNAPLADVKRNTVPKATSGMLSDEDYYARTLTGKTRDEVLAALSPQTNQLATVKGQVEGLKKERDDLTKAYNENRDQNLERQLSRNGLSLRVRERELQRVAHRVSIVERYLQPASAEAAPGAIGTKGSNRLPVTD